MKTPQAMGIYSQWEKTRLSVETSRWSNVPLVGRILKVILRIRLLGRLLMLQSKLYDLLLNSTVQPSETNEKDSIVAATSPIPGINFRTANWYRDFTYQIARYDGETSDHVLNMIDQGIFYATPAYSLLYSLIRAGDRVFDVGAHVGTFSMPAAALGASVVAIEGSPRNVYLLRTNLLINALPQIQVINAVVTDRFQFVHFQEFGPWGHVRFDPNQAASVIPGIAIDELVEQLQWPSVQFIKLDIEGSEPMAVRGMLKLLARADAPDLVIESSRPHLRDIAKSSPEHLKQSLSDLGYSIFIIDHQTLIPVTPQETQIDVFLDYFCTKRETQLTAHLTSQSWKIAPPMTVEQKAARLKGQAVISAEIYWRDELMRILNMLQKELKDFPVSESDLTTH